MSLFGGSSTGAFGATQTQRPSLFGGSASQQPTGTQSLFGQPQSQPQQQQQASKSLFGQPVGTQSKSLFGLSTQSGAHQQPQQLQQQQAALGASGILGASLAQSSPWNLSMSNQIPQEKPINARLEEVFKKWFPGSPDCVFQHYFYNKVPDDQAVYFRPGPQENEAKWEEALSKKPGKGYVPVLCVGFQQLSERIALQSTIVAALNRKLHEINNSLTVMLQNHDLVISIRAEEVRRKHMVLAQKCLGLATKIQILRNRGYAMGADEEELKKKLTALESTVLDPSISGRAEEIWARMVDIRERGRILQSELDRLGQGSADNQSDSIDPSILGKAEKILEDYAKQLHYLKKELDRITKDFSDWKGETTSSNAAKGGR